MTIELPGLIGTNPLGFLAGLGVLDVLARASGQAQPTLRWTNGLAPHPVVEGADDLDQIVDLVDADRGRWGSSPVLSWQLDGHAVEDLKVSAEHMREWAAGVAATARHDRADVDLFQALLAEGATAGKGDSKPTHLHFTAGQQRFLVMVRELQRRLEQKQVVEALAGPWRHDSELPVLGWHAGGERIYAVRGTDPSKEKRTGVPGADWLAFLGLRFLPVAARFGTLITTGCAPRWKTGSFTWPLWDVPLGVDVIRSLLGDASLVERSRSQLAALGVTQVLRAPIRRSDQGGYGSFGTAETVPTGHGDVPRHE